MPYKIEATCPECGKKAKSIEQIEEAFGFRTIDEKKIPQSWCRNCR